LDRQAEVRRIFAVVVARQERMTMDCLHLTWDEHHSRLIADACHDLAEAGFDPGELGGVVREIATEVMR
jgi:hypothetical protein